ncbi:hypothetical protein CR159_13880 [Pollutimonas subterranea]|uniref:Uncharacterized protein n=1 Tax=Pollutimonas subterranea TaxID=2045210 RepID=A0A2N4U2Y1_9BURK|nr:hypothetical protein [Pollutimonas subterranea]PLC49382.1 hypothetical protein CR159_13880 [Pollutimonas subterranea]
MKSKLHGIFGAVALLCIATFWLSTVVSELFLTQAGVVAVKNAVLTGMWLLIPAMAATGGSGFSLAKGRRGRLVDVKMRRMKGVAANGLLVLLPSAFVLASWANAGRFDGAFYALQGVELLAGAVNITLLLLNMRDGLRLTGRLSPKRSVPPAAR